MDYYWEFGGGAMKNADENTYDTEEDKMMALFTAVHGELPKKYRMEMVYDENCKLECVKVWKGENLCWEATKLDLLFDFITTKLQFKHD